MSVPTPISTSIHARLYPKVPVNGATAREHFNYKADYSLEDGVAEMAEIFRARA